MRKFFELNKPYQFDINDVVALIYVICAGMGIAGLNATPSVSAWLYHRIYHQPFGSPHQSASHQRSIHRTQCGKYFQTFFLKSIDKSIKV